MAAFNPLHRPHLYRVVTFICLIPGQIGEKMANNLSHGRSRPLLDESLQSLVSGGLKGIEKEGLRMNPKGSISLLPHPARLGAALAHPNITTDYSEALLELITLALADGDQMLAFLADLHKYVCANIGDELLLAASMPVGDLRTIPVARYGPSNVGKMKHIYRQGLSHRYGSCMQIIAGIHFNYSLPEQFWPQYQHLMKHRGDLRACATDAYMGMIRNLQRYGWLIPYLFGSSPAVSDSFVHSRNSAYCLTLKKWDERSYYKPFATSLRTSGIGYVNPVQSMFPISFNSLDEYMRDLGNATMMPYPEYEKICIKKGGQYLQLNDRFLQIENEYYTSVRPKQPTRSNERPLQALRSRGVQYVEIRSVDIDIFEPAGISIDTACFLEAFSLLCLFKRNLGHDSRQQEEIGMNSLSVANRGRDPSLRLSDNGTEIPLRNWALGLCGEMQEICDALDRGNPARPYTAALNKQIEAIRHPELTPSARVLSVMRDEKLSITELTLQKSREYTQYFRSSPLEEAARRNLDFQGRASLEQLQRLNAMTAISFDKYLNDYFGQEPAAEKFSSQDLRL